MQNRGNPEAMLKQVMGNMTNEQKENLYKQCKQYNVPEQILAKIQNK